MVRNALFPIVGHPSFKANDGFNEVMKVAVTTLGRFHHFDLARQLYKADAFAGIFTPYPRFKLQNEGLPPELVHSYPLLAMIQQIGWRVGRPQRPYGEIDWQKILDIDRRAAKGMPECDAYIAIATAGLFSGAEAQRRGAVYLCDRPCTHIRNQYDILREEYPLYGYEFQNIEPRIMERQEIEYDRADAVLVPSTQSLESFVRQGIPRERVLLAPYGVDLSDFYPEVSPNDERFEVLFVGSLSVRKGIRYLLEAFERFEHPNKHLTLVGGQTRETRDLVRKAVATGKVTATGAVSRERVRGYMSRSHAFVLASVEEGLALVQGQAMACGCPVIASSSTGSEDLYTDGVEGFIVPPRDPIAIADRLQRLADEPELRKRMSEASLERVKSMGGWDAYGKTILDHLRRVIEGKENAVHSARARATYNLP